MKTKNIKLMISLKGKTEEDVERYSTLLRYKLREAQEDIQNDKGSILLSLIKS